METNKEYLSIADYAKARGVSVAAVYKRLDGTLKKYVKEIDGQKFLAVEVLAAEGIKPVEYPLNTGLNSPENGEHPGEESTGKPASQDTTTPAILAALEALERQLSEKDKQISRLQEEAAGLRQEAQAKDKFIQEQASRLTLLLEQSQELQRNNQVLIGLAQGRTPARPEEVPEDEAPAGRQYQEAQEQPRPAGTPAPGEEAPAESKAAPASPGGFWRRIFGGKKK